MFLVAEAMKTIDTHGLINLNPLEHSNEWYWAMDYTGGDLYEAEEIYHKGDPFKNNRVMFIHYPDGETVEPVKTLPNQYLGIPVFSDGAIINLLVDFAKELIQIIRYEHENKVLSIIAALPLSIVSDCYNLRLTPVPLMLIRQGGGNQFEIIWPERTRFHIEDSESFTFRIGNRLYFQMWHEDPEYHEEVIVRDMFVGKILERFSGTIIEMPDGQKWLLI